MPLDLDSVDTLDPVLVAALGMALRQLREKRGLTQEALAHEAQIITGSLSLIERGHRNPSWGTVSRLAEALGASMGEVGELTDKLGR